MSRIRSRHRLGLRSAGLVGLLTLSALGGCQTSEKPASSQGSPPSTSARAAPTNPGYSNGPVIAAAPAPGVPGPLKWKLVPRTASSIPFATVVLPGAPAELNTVDLAKYGYVEEEYFLTGAGNVYAPAAKGVVKANVPYTTRILVRRPADPKKFSGTVQLEPSRDQNEWTTTWLAAWPYFLKHGDVFVAWSMAADNVPAMIKKFDPVRYAPIDISDNGLRWDILAQTAWLMRSPEGPLAKLGFLHQAAKVKGGLQVYSTGWSLTGGMQAIFINDGHHARARRPDGKPVIDAYLPGISGGPVATLPDATVIRVMSESEYANPNGSNGRPGAWSTRRADDDSGVRFREYDIAGTSHAGWIDQSQFTVPFYQLGLTAAVSANCTHLPADLPGKVDVIRAILSDLDRWVRTGVAAPPSQFFTLTADHAIERDNFGNAEGGVRPYWVEAPTSQFRIDNDAVSDANAATGRFVCGQLGYEAPLAATDIKTLYPTRAAYVAKGSKALDAQVKAGFLLAADAAAEKRRIEKAAVP